MAPADSPPITDLSDGALAELVAALGGKPFQARQLSHWVYKHGAVDFDECQNLPKSLRTRLRDRGPLLQSRIVKTVRSADGTSKFLIELRDAEAPVLVGGAQHAARPQHPRQLAKDRLRVGGLLQ